MSDDANRRHDGPVLPCETEPVSEYEALFEPPPAAVPRRRGWWPFKPSRREAAKAADVAHRAAMPEVTGAEAPPVVAPPASGPEAAPEVVASAVEVAAPPDSESLPAPAPEVVASAVEIAAPPDSESLPAPAPAVVATAAPETTIHAAQLEPSAESSSMTTATVAEPEIPEVVPAAPPRRHGKRRHKQRPGVPTVAPAPEPPVVPDHPAVEIPTGRPGPYIDPAAEVPIYTDEEIETPDRPAVRRRGLATTLVVLGAATAAFVTGLFVFNNMIMPRFIHSSAEVVVPELSSLNYEQAEQALRPLGLVLSRAGERFDPSVPRGFILSQDPPPDTPVRGRKRVMVVVSLGEEYSSVPSLFGESLRSARFLLQRSGLRVTGITRAPSDEVGEGLVSGTDPPPETVLPRNATVALLVSSGTGQDQYVMPDLLGREITGVRRHLESLGFRVTTPPAAPSVGTIVYQEPGAGSRITIDTPINLQATGRIIR
ncbi:MAG: PASTA domain-containing protein [Candidatus Eisenbacteria bacterium]|uniref:PASTA domain-containing protein n=1 Tax=Eiseniibacteriota bacterium TaxID=2212470 RepID=A0A538U7Z7_UNCEI|nr:MAG: PASTA domain-containing protein [Candidatus Eisenbacteria bacterium]